MTPPDAQFAVNLILLSSVFVVACLVVLLWFVRLLLKNLILETLVELMQGRK